MATMPEPHPTSGRAGVGIGHARDARETLSVAEGILIALRRCGQPDAFDELLRVAQRHHLSVLTVAHALVDLAIDAHPPLGSRNGTRTPMGRWPNGSHISHSGRGRLGSASAPILQWIRSTRTTAATAFSPYAARTAPTVTTQ